MEHRNGGTYRVGRADPDDDDSYNVYRQRHGSQVVLCGKDWGLYEDDARLIAAAYNHLGAALEELDRLRAQVARHSPCGEDTCQ
jgi:hypothetical protein